jgi:hypothetical protein
MQSRIWGPSFLASKSATQRTKYERPFQFRDHNARRICRILPLRHTYAADDGFALFCRGKPLIEAGLATIGRVAMNDPALGSFVYR